MVRIKYNNVPIMQKSGSYVVGVHGYRAILVQLRSIKPTVIINEY